MGTKLVAPGAGSISIEGVEIPVDADGLVDVPDELAEHIPTLIESHGFQPPPPERPSKSAKGMS